MLFTFIVNPQLHTLVESNSLLRLILNFLCVTHSEYANQTDSLCTRLRRVLFYNQNLGKTFASKEFVCLCAELCVRFYFPPFSFAIFFFYIQKQITNTQVFHYTHAPSISTSSYSWQSYHCFGSLLYPNSNATMFISAFLSFFANY